jgi:hypothetical protein
MTSRRTQVIACPSLRPELEQLAPEGVSLHFLDMALHQRSSEALRSALQAAIDGTTDCATIAIGYGLCNRGVIGIEARAIPLVVPRAHDCVGLLLGSTARHLAELDSEPGTYFQSAGWLQAAHDEGASELTFGPNSNASFERLAVRYGEEAAGYLMAQLDGFTQHYKRLAYIASSVAETPAFETEARNIASKRGLEYHRIDADTGWLGRLIGGVWSESEFLIVRPGQRVVFTGTGGLIEAV